MTTPRHLLAIVGFITLLAAGGCGSTSPAPTYELVIANGRVMDPESNLDVDTARRTVT